jgi:hypothetical protein
MPSFAGTISGVSYQKITSLVPNENWIIDPYDLSGNLLSEITIEVDTTLGIVTLFPPYLTPYNILNAPYYSTNGSNNIAIKIIKISNDPNVVNVNTISGTIFSGANTPNQMYLSSIGDSITITPIGTTAIYEVLLNWALQ